MLINLLFLQIMLYLCDVYAKLNRSLCSLPNPVFYFVQQKYSLC